MLRPMASASLALVAVAGVAGLMYYRADRTAERPVVTTATVTRGDVVATVEATGSLQAVTTVQVGTQVSGTIKALYADFNDQVRRGQVVAQLDPSLFQTQVDQARATIVRLEADATRTRVQDDDARLKLRRARELSARSLLPASDLESAETTARLASAAVASAEAQIVQARAALQQSQVNLEHCVIRAPIDGIVISRSVDVGQTVAASMQAPTLFVIAQDLSKMQVNASIAEADIGHIAAGQPVRFRVDAYPGTTFTGVVSRVRLDPVVQQNVVSYVTTIDVPNPQKLLKPGMTATVTVEVARATDVVRVPAAALRVHPSAEVLAALGSSQPAATTAERPRRAMARGAEGASEGEVWVQREGRLVPVAVTVGTTDATQAAIVAGALTEGTEVVTNILTGGTASTPSTSTRSPLLPAGRRPGGAGRP